jgi:hypothetical protein
MNMKALDTASPTNGHAHDLLHLGYQAVGIYLRPDRAPKLMIEGLDSVGVKMFSVWERGEPTSAEYFNAAKGTIDAREAIAYAKLIGMPAGSVIFFAIDYDASDEDLRGPLLDYMQNVHRLARDAGYLVGVYGSGQACEHFIHLGFAHYGWLAGATRWKGYLTYKPKAAIVQGGTRTVLGLDVDLDTIQDPAVLWSPVKAVSSK